MLTGDMLSWFGGARLRVLGRGFRRGGRGSLGGFLLLRRNRRFLGGRRRGRFEEVRGREKHQSHQRECQKQPRFGRQLFLLARRRVVWRVAHGTRSTPPE